MSTSLEPESEPRPGCLREAFRSLFLILLVLITWSPTVAMGDPSQLERAERSDEDLLILSLEVGSYRLSDGLLAFSDKRGLLLPLGQLISSLELPMELNVDRGRVEGRLVDPGQIFSLDFRTKTVTRSGVSRQLPADALLEAHQDELYIGSELLAAWWSVEIHIDSGELLARLVSEPPLPIESRLARRAKWTRSSSPERRPHKRNAPHLALHEPYRFVDWPAIDSTFDVAWQRSGTGETSRLATHSMFAQGDFLGMTADLFWSGTDENGSRQVSGRRFSLSRTDPEAGLLGPLRANKVRAGDLLSAGHPLITHGRGGRGITIERGRERFGNHFDQTTLRGDVLPGWDVELYRGDQLLDFQTADADGRYEFREIALRVGPNDLRIIMFGPHGERRERVERILVGAAALPPGEIRYRADLMEQGRGLFSGNPGVKPGDDMPTPGQGETVLGGTFEYGLSRRWTAAAGVLSLPIEAEGQLKRHSYTWMGLEGSLFGAASLFELVRDLEGGWAGRLAAQRKIGAIALRLEHRQFLSFLSETGPRSESMGVTEVRLDTRLPLRGRNRIPFSLRSTWEQRENGTVFRARGELAHTAQLGSIRLANRWAIEAENHDFSANGRTTLEGRFGMLPIRGRLAYQGWPQAELTSLDLEMRWEKNDRRSAALGVAYDLQSKVARLRAGLEWQTRRHVLGMSLEGATDGSLSLQLSSRFSLRRDATTKRYRMRADASAKQGMAQAFVFLDDNGNGIYDEGDQALPKVAFELEGRRHGTATDGEGLAFLAIGSHRRTDLRIAEGSLEDPAWLSSRPNTEVLTRPGRTEFIAFPILEAGEIDGTVYLVRGDGKKAVGGVALELINKKGKVVSSTESQYDGFYLFEKILPGTYRLRISPSTVESSGVESLEPVDLVMDVGMIRSGVDLHLKFPHKKADTSQEF